MGTYTDNGIYLPDFGESGWDDEVNTNLSLLSQAIDDIAALQDQISNEGPAGQTGQTIVMFRQEGEVTLATGSEPFPLPFDCDILGARVSCSVPATVTDVVCDVLVNNVSLWQLADDRPSLPVGEYSGAEATPDTTTGYVSNDLMTVDITTVGPPTSGGLQVDVRDVSDPVSSNNGTKSSFAIPIPGAYHVGDLLICYVATLSQTISTIPSGWAYIDGSDPVEDTDHANSLHIYTLWKTADTDESAAQTVSLSGGTPMLAVTVAIQNPLDINGQPDATVTDFNGTSGTTFTTTAITTALDAELVIWAVASRWGATETPSNIEADLDLTVDYAGYADRSATPLTSLGLTVAHLYQATVATSDAYDWTTTENARFVGRSVALFEGPSSDTPGENVTCTIRIREAT